MVALVAGTMTGGRHADSERAAARGVSGRVADGRSSGGTDQREDRARRVGLRSMPRTDQRHEPCTGNGGEIARCLSEVTRAAVPCARTSGQSNTISSSKVFVFTDTRGVA